MASTQTTEESIVKNFIKRVSNFVRHDHSKKRARVLDLTFLTNADFKADFACFCNLVCQKAGKNPICLWTKHDGVMLSLFYYCVNHDSVMNSGKCDESLAYLTDRAREIVRMFAELDNHVFEKRHDSMVATRGTSSLLEAFGYNRVCYLYTLFSLFSQEHCMGPGIGLRVTQARTTFEAKLQDADASFRVCDLICMQMNANWNNFQNLDECMVVVGEFIEQILVGVNALMMLVQRPKITVIEAHQLAVAIFRANGYTTAQFAVRTDTGLVDPKSLAAFSVVSDYERLTSLHFQSLFMNFCSMLRNCIFGYESVVKAPSSIVLQICDGVSFYLDAVSMTMKDSIGIATPVLRYAGFHVPAYLPPSCKGVDKRIFLDLHSRVLTSKALLPMGPVTITATAAAAANAAAVGLPAPAAATTTTTATAAAGASEVDAMMFCS